MAPGKGTLSDTPTFASQVTIGAKGDEAFIQKCRTSGQTPLWPVGAAPAPESNALWFVPQSHPVARYNVGKTRTGGDPAIVCTMNGAGHEEYAKANAVKTALEKKFNIVLTDQDVKNIALKMVEDALTFEGVSRNRMVIKRSPDAIVASGLVQAFLFDEKIKLGGHVRLALPSTDPAENRKYVQSAVIGMDPNQVVLTYKEHTPLDFSSRFVTQRILDPLRTHLGKPGAADRGGKSYANLLQMTPEDYKDEKVAKEKALLRGWLRGKIAFAIAFMQAVATVDAPGGTLLDALTSGGSFDNMINALGLDNGGVPKAGLDDAIAEALARTLLTPPNAAGATPAQKFNAKHLFSEFQAIAQFKEDYDRNYIGRVVTLDPDTRLGSLLVSNP